MADYVIEFSLDGGTTWRHGRTIEAWVRNDPGHLRQQRQIVRDQARQDYGDVEQVATRVLAEDDPRAEVNRDPGPDANGCVNPSHAGVGTSCAGCARACEAELTALNDRYMRLLNDQDRDRRSSEAAARRDAQDHMRAFAHLYLSETLRQYAPHIANAIGRATQIDPAMGRRLLDRSRLLSLKTEAERAQQFIWEHIEPAREDFAADPREAEITRLREVIVAAGQRLHDQYASVPSPRPPGWMCTCPGCDLIRDMDTAGLPAGHQCRAGCEHDPGDGHSPVTGIARND